MFCKFLKCNNCQKRALNNLNICNDNYDLLEHEHKVNARPVESQCGTKLTREVQRARVVRRHPEPRDGERTLKCESPRKVLSLSSAAVMVKGELMSPTAHNAWPQNNHPWWSARGKKHDYG